MAFELNDCQFTGPALPLPFVKFELEKELSRLNLLPKDSGDEGKLLRERWEVYRRKLRMLTSTGGPLRVQNHIIEPLIQLLGYSSIGDTPDVKTREDIESGGKLLVSKDGAAKLRVWTTSFDEDLYAPARRGRAYRYSHLRIAQRVLLATNERLGLLTNGVQLLILIGDPARPDSTIGIPVDAGWKRTREVPDSFRLLLAIASPAGVMALPEIVDKARLQQARVTKELRVQARQAVERFIQEIIDHPENRAWFESHPDKDALAKELWHEGLIVVYRLLFILKLEACDDHARAFSFASGSLWRNSFSPSMKLAPHAHDVLEKGVETGHFLEQGLRNLFRMFRDGLECTELNVKPLGGALFGKSVLPNLEERVWGERAVAWLLDRLLWTPRQRGSEARERVHYGPLDVEDLGRVYEALLELDPGISSERMCRLRRQKLEVVVPSAQGERYRPVTEQDSATVDEENDGDDSDETGEEESKPRRKKTKVEWIEEIPHGRFYLRVGLGRKASGSYYTPHSFVRFLVQETLGPQVEEKSPKENPNPDAILKLKVLDPAMGSGHFLVEACRFLALALYEACRLCDEKALEAEHKAGEATRKEEREAALRDARQWRQRVIDLPDPNDELLLYLPSRAPERGETGFSAKRAEAICRRLIATHCLYGVDKNPLAVELAKLALWIESHAEGMPLTFLDHRLVLGDSLTGPFWEYLRLRPSRPSELLEADLLTSGLFGTFQVALTEALEDVKELESTVGSNAAELEHKQAFKDKLDRSLIPFRVAAAAWAGGVMLGPNECDDSGYTSLLKSIGEHGRLPSSIQPSRLRNMIAKGLGVQSVSVESAEIVNMMLSQQCSPSLSFDLAFPEVFYPRGIVEARYGFDTVLGNPPWDRMLPADKEFFAAFEFEIVNSRTKRERAAIQERLLTNATVSKLYKEYISRFRSDENALDSLYKYQVVELDGESTIGKQDAFRAFMERNYYLMAPNGFTGVVVPSAFHANEGATGIRQLYLKQTSLKKCYSFENRFKLFEIHSSFKFALVVACKPGPTTDFECGFYLHRDEWLFGTAVEGQVRLRYDLDLVERTGGQYLSLIELRSEEDALLAKHCYSSGRAFSTITDRIHLHLARETNITDDWWRYAETADVIRNAKDPRRGEVTRDLVGGQSASVDPARSWQRL